MITSPKDGSRSDVSVVVPIVSLLGHSQVLLDSCRRSVARFMTSNVAYVGDAMSSFVARLVRIGVTGVVQGGLRKRQVENAHFNGPLYSYIEGVCKRQQVGVSVCLVFRQVVMQWRYFSRGKTFCLAVGLWVVLTGGDVIQLDSATNRHKKF